MGFFRDDLVVPFHDDIIAGFVCSEHLADSFKNVFDAYSESVNRSIFYFISHNCKRCVIRCSFQLHSKSFSWCSSTTCMCEALGLQSPGH